MPPLKIVFMANNFPKHFYRKTWINLQKVYLDFKIQAGFFIIEQTFTRKMIVCLF